MSHPFGYCQVSIAPVRAEAKDSAEMITQLLFGEVVEVIESDRQWRKVRNMIDSYEGWTDEKLISPLTAKEMKRWMDVQTPIYNGNIQIEGKHGSINLTKGAFLPFSQENDFAIGNDRYSVSSEQLTTSNDIEEVALSYRNAPYLWGGRTNFGIDCSGYTQMVYRFLGYALPRDAYQQAEDGREIEFEDRQIGDLAFFDNDKGKITHVGILLSNNSIIHAHGHVVVDVLKEEGIYSEERQVMSHKLCLIKRYL